MTLFLAIAIAILQGVTELFPVSSLGHAVIIPALFGLPIDIKAPEYLPFLVVLHVGTAVALLFPIVFIILYATQLKHME